MTLSSKGHQESLKDLDCCNGCTKKKKGIQATDAECNKSIIGTKISRLNAWRPLNSFIGIAPGSSSEKQKFQVALC